jgi:Flp pilus assembly protein TadD
MILLAGALTYANSLSGPFVFDDRGTILDNSTIERLWHRSVLAAPHETPAAGRPVVNVSFALNYAVGERNVRGYHLGNILSHLLCALLVFAIVRRTLDASSLRPPAASLNIALAVALIRAVHPLNSEVVDYISQRTESLMAFFYLSTLYASIRAAFAPRSRRWEALAVICCALGMASKESMVTAPLMVLAYDRVFIFDSFKTALQTRWRLYLGLAAGWIVLAVLVATNPRSLSAGFSAHDAAPWTYLLNQAVMIARYLQLAVWPVPLAIYYGWPLPLTLGDVWPQMLLVVTLLALTIVALVRYPKLGILGVWFFVTLAPTSSIVPIATEVGAERRMYLPLVAVILLLVLAGARLWQGMTRALSLRVSSRADGLAAICVLALVIGLLAARTFYRNGEYASSFRLAETTLERWPTPAAHSMFGTELAALGRFAEAEAHLRQASPDFPPARYYLGTVLARVGKQTEAVAELETFIRARDQPAALDQVHLARAQLAEIFMKQSDWTRAAGQYALMVEARPADREARGLLAAALVRQHSYDQAIEHYRVLVAEHPHDLQALSGLGVALASSGRLEEAVAVLRRVVELDPANDHAQQNLARALQLAKATRRD